MHMTETLGLDLRIRIALKAAVDSYSKGRASLCEEVSKHLGRPVSPFTLDNWIAQGKRAWRLPADVVPAIGAVTGDTNLEQLMLSDKSLHHLKLGEFVMEHSRVWRFVERELMRVVFAKLYGKKDGARWFRAACRVVAAQNRKWDADRSRKR
jgi:hypothetical protein